ncbi:hypothetical protein BLNAU_17030 [Blattamonas nauphoetae]|uniref:Uncharacterized protein n=1 Tax=Blattamonas nauphoetae TaxID=2049346 RepID=A0ABQ9X7U6_9EUKA|nr:hypothetical protein BLNAU_17030 [Blattamonas nauphoetae]
MQTRGRQWGDLSNPEKQQQIAVDDKFTQFEHKLYKFCSRHTVSYNAAGSDDFRDLANELIQVGKRSNHQEINRLGKFGQKVILDALTARRGLCGSVVIDGGKVGPLHFLLAIFVAPQTTFEPLLIHTSNAEDDMNALFYANFAAESSAILIKHGIKVIGFVADNAIALQNGLRIVDQIDRTPQPEALQQSVKQTSTPLVGRCHNHLLDLAWTDAKLFSPHLKIILETLHNCTRVFPPNVSKQIGSSPPTFSPTRWLDEIRPVSWKFQKFKNLAATRFVTCPPILPTKRAHSGEDPISDVLFDGPVPSATKVSKEQTHTIATSLPQLLPLHPLSSLYIPRTGQLSMTMFTFHKPLKVSSIRDCPVKIRNLRLIPHYQLMFPPIRPPSHHPITQNRKALFGTLISEIVYSPPQRHMRAVKTGFQIPSIATLGDDSQSEDVLPDELPHSPSLVLLSNLRSFHTEIYDGFTMTAHSVFRTIPASLAEEFDVWLNHEEAHSERLQLTDFRRFGDNIGIIQKLKLSVTVRSQWELWSRRKLNVRDISRISREHSLLPAEGCDLSRYSMSWPWHFTASESLGSSKCLRQVLKFHTV